MTFDRKDAGSGAFFVAVGLIYGFTAISSLPIGRLLDMGPGYFPIVLSGALVALGLSLVIRSFFRSGSTPFGVVSWRAVALLTASTIAFALTFEGLGMLLSVMVTCLVASFARPGTKPVTAALTSLCIAGFCVAVFIYGVRLPVSAIGPWLLQ